MLTKSLQVARLSPRAAAAVGIARHGLKQRLRIRSGVMVLKEALWWIEGKHF
jgi:hypothetical protein